MIDYSNEPINEKILKNSITHFDGLITEIQKYDVYDFIARVAGMSLTPQNQNKTVYFNSIISDVLSHSKDEFLSSIKMSPSKFKQLLKTVENSPLRSIIDPNENFYIQRVLYKGNKRIICGSDGEAAYILQIISKILFEKNNPYPSSFISKMRCLFDFCIGISEKAIEELSLSNDITIDDDNRDIFFPDCGLYALAGEFRDKIGIRGVVTGIKRIRV